MICGGFVSGAAPSDFSKEWKRCHGLGAWHSILDELEMKQAKFKGLQGPCWIL